MSQGRKATAATVAAVVRGGLPGLALLLLSLVLAVPSARAQTESEIQANRQLEFAKNEIAEGSFERALASASAAFRLDPTLYDALVYKALAYEGLGELRLAEGLITTYMDIRGDLDPLPLATEALARVNEKLGNLESNPGGGEPEGGGGEPEGGSGEDPGEEATTEGEPKEDGPGEGEEATPGSGEDTSAPEDPEGGEAETDEAVVTELILSAPYLAALELRYDRRLLETRRDVGLGLVVSGLGLAATGGVMMLISSEQYFVLSSSGEPTVQVTAVYSGGIGMVGSGAAMSLVGLPLLIKSGTDLKKMKAAEAGVAHRVQPRLELAGQGLQLRF